MADRLGSMKICKYINFGSGEEAIRQEKSTPRPFQPVTYIIQPREGGGVKHILIYDPKSTNSHTQRYRFNVLTLAKYDFRRAETVRSFINHAAGQGIIDRPPPPPVGKPH